MPRCGGGDAVHRPDPGDGPGSRHQHAPKAVAMTGCGGAGQVARPCASNDRACRFAGRTRFFEERTCEFDESACGIVERVCEFDERACGVVERTCGFDERACGVVGRTCEFDERACGVVERTCELVETTCGIEFMRSRFIKRSSFRMRTSSRGD